MKSLIFLVGVLAMTACSGGDPADVEGMYTVSTTNRDDGCHLGWNVGDTNQGITVVITQNGESAIAEIQGGAGFLVGIVVGTNTLSGSVDGNDLDLFAAGTRPKTSGNCTYTTDGRINATLTGDALQGTMRYIANTNNNTDCAAVACTSTQDFAGTRPPK
jgi:hypothetical protein